MSAITKPIEVDGFVNLLEALKAAGYTGGGRPRMLLIDNIDTDAVYVHFTNSNDDGDLTGTDGIKLSGGAASERRSLDLIGGIEGDIPDLAHTFLYAAATVDVTVSVFGN